LFFLKHNKPSKLIKYRQFFLDDSGAAVGGAANGGAAEETEEN